VTPDGKLQKERAAIPSQAELERELNSFDPDVRAGALERLLTLAEAGGIACRPWTERSNLHAHSFHSYNARGFSPSALAWVARREGIGLMGIVDFDTLAGTEEFLTACDRAGVHGTAGIETRVWLPALAGKVVNSPGEPGVAYMMGIGFTRTPPPPPAREVLDELGRGARARNSALIDRINARLPEVAIDPARDVEPLSPSGTPTERHIVRAYAERAAGASEEPAAFWARAFDEPADRVPDTAEPASPEFGNWLRARLIKRGGIGYLPPGPDTFPPAETFIRFIEECSALPCAAWLDGTSAGERDPEALLDLYLDLGILVINIIPDRNWNLTDKQGRAEKIYHLHALVAAARWRGLPVIAGTEMNAPGQKLVDDFVAPALAPLRRTLTDGAWFVRGHTIMQEETGLGWWSGWAGHHLPERTDRVAFYTRLARALPPGELGLEVVAGLNADLEPAAMLARIGRREI